jgi:hypothetical protein
MILHKFIRKDKHQQNKLIMGTAPYGQLKYNQQLREHFMALEY